MIVDHEFIGDLACGGYYAWMAERIRRGSMDRRALGCANRMFRSLDKAAAQRLGAFEALPALVRSGAWRVQLLELVVANAFVTQYHRHLNGVVGHLASFGLYDDAGLRGVMILGRPLARHADDANTVEVLRMATDGSRNACSKLYGAARRFARERGYARVLTYTLPDEGGASLRASGFAPAGFTSGGHWTRTTRRRVTKAPVCRKQRWILRVMA